MDGTRVQAFGDRTSVPGQGNNVFIVHPFRDRSAKQITDEMFYRWARATPEQATDSELEAGLICPPQSTILVAELRVAERAAQAVGEEGRSLSR